MLNDNEMKKMEEKFGSEKMNNFANFMLELLASSGDKRAIILKKRDENKDLFKELMDKCVMNDGAVNDEKLDKIVSFMEQINTLTKDLIKEMEEN